MILKLNVSINLFLINSFIVKCWLLPLFESGTVSKERLVGSYRIAWKNHLMDQIIVAKKIQPKTLQQLRQEGRERKD